MLFRNPLGVDLPFLGDTTYDNHFKPFQTGPGNGEPKLAPVFFELMLGFRQGTDIRRSI